MLLLTDIFATILGSTVLLSSSSSSSSILTPPIPTANDMARPSPSTSVVHVDHHTEDLLSLSEAHSRISGLMSSWIPSSSLVASALPLPFEPSTGNTEMKTSSQSLSSSSSPTTSTTSDNPYENYLPRRLYPATYANFCGPTPEVTKSCVAHGWHGDDPIDRVDGACRIHDISYCSCQSQLLIRNINKQQGDGKQETATMVVDPETLKQIPLLSTLTALRHIITKPGLEFIVEQIASDETNEASSSDDHRIGNGKIGRLTAAAALGKQQRRVLLDKEYFDCVNKADKQLLETGIRLRSEIQRTQCSMKATTTSVLESTSQSLSSTDAAITSSSADPSLSWFCDVNEKDGTLAKFEKISLDLFLRNLDSDEEDRDSRKKKSSSLSLVELEKRRQDDLRKEIIAQQQAQQDADGGRIAAKVENQLPPTKIGQAASSQKVLEDEELMLQRLQ